MSKHLEALNELFRRFQEQMAEDDSQAENAGENGRTTLERLGYMRLKAMNRFMQVIDATIAGFLLLKESVANDIGNLSQELYEHFGVKDSESPVENTSDAEDKPPAQSPDDVASDPKPRHERKPRGKTPLEYQRLPKHRATGSPRLDMLETALHDALECLNNAKIAYHFKAIKEVRLALTELYKSWDKPEEERIFELEAELKDAAERLSANPSAAKSKVMRNLRSDIIVALQNKDDHE